MFEFLFHTGINKWASPIRDFKAGLFREFLFWAGPFHEFLIGAGLFRESFLWCWPIRKNFSDFFFKFSTPVCQFLASNSSFLR